MSGRDIYTKTRAGASAVQLGTAFLPCLECTASTAHKRYILEESPRETVLTTAFSGRPARGIRNAFVDRMDSARTLPFPLQNTLTSVLRAQAQRDDDGELQSLWVGAAYLQARSRLRDHDVAHARDARLEGSWRRGRESSQHYSEEQRKEDELENDSRMSASYPSAGALIELLHREYEQCQK
jgi:NAD(P)H-dependent flavin oxidoreductase YrpB (nitropropane dioxygenase family)